MNYDNTNRGALFKNTDKQQESHPDYKGSLNVAEDDYWINAWLKTSKDGKKYMSLSVQPKMKAPPKVESKSPQPDFDDDIGF